MTRYPTQRPFRALVAVDGSENSLAGVCLLGDLPITADSEITILSIVEPEQETNQTAIRTGIAQAETILQDTGAKVTTHLVHGRPTTIVMEYADRQGYDLLVLGARGLRARFGVLLGGTALRLVDCARSPVLIARAPFQGLKKILLVSDGSPASLGAAQFLGKLTCPAGTEVRLLHVISQMLPPEVLAQTWSPGPWGFSPMPIQDMEDFETWRTREETEGQWALEKTARALRAYQIEPTQVLLHGDPGEEIVQYVHRQKIDLVLAGSHDKLQGWLIGSVPRKIVYGSHSSVLVVKYLPANQLAQF